MARVTRRKVPVTSSSKQPSASGSSNPHSSRTLIRRFHVLLKKQTRLRKEPANVSNKQALAAVEKEIEELGGLSAYQRMSAIGQGNDRGGGTEKIFVEWLKELEWNHVKGKGKHKLLEVGALKPDNYNSCSSWLDVQSIDLHSQHSSILEQDFLLMDAVHHQGKWDLISLSLVVNFVPDAHDRGRMLQLAHRMLRRDGLLFLALPLPCVTNSRYTTSEHLRALMEMIGFTQLQERWKPGGKMAYWLYRKAEPATLPRDHRFLRKTVLRQGNRNNFAILLQSTTASSPSG
ncbi:nucleolus protein [Dentipellis sp. KUC8613]|nr:nucleolus protein [Dentipellis sp. KUC8613]